jgi:hypothetical protein
VKTFGALTFRPNSRSWRLADVPAHVALRLKAVFPRIRREDVAPFDFPDSDETRADLAWFVKRYPMALAADDRTRLRRGSLDFEMKREAIERILLPDWTPDAPRELKPPYQFWSYQEQAIEVARRLGRLILIDPASAGKTLEVIGAVMGKDTLPAAIAVEPHLRSQWRRSIEKFTHLTPHVIESTRPYSLPKADVYILGHNALAYWTDVADTGFFRSFAADECQTYRAGPGTSSSPILKYKAAQVFAKHAGHNLFCTCDKGAPCHGDILVRLANGLACDGLERLLPRRAA